MPFTCFLRQPMQLNLCLCVTKQWILECHWPHRWQQNMNVQICHLTAWSDDHLNQILLSPLVLDMKPLIYSCPSSSQPEWPDLRMSKSFLLVWLWWHRVKMKYFQLTDKEGLSLPRNILLSIQEQTSAWSTAVTEALMQAKIHLWGYLHWQWRKNCSGIAERICRLLLQIALAWLHSSVFKFGCPTWNCPPGPPCCDKNLRAQLCAPGIQQRTKALNGISPSKIKSLELKITPQQSDGRQKGKEIINCKLGWLMLPGRAQNFEDGLKISCHSWFCEKALGQNAGQIPLWVPKAALEGGWLSSIACLLGAGVWFNPTRWLWGHRGV